MKRIWNYVTLISLFYFGICVLINLVSGKEITGPFYVIFIISGCIVLGDGLIRSLLNK
jgi:hypothetical protein